MTTRAPASAATEEYSLPSAEALLAGTLALMTGYVQACCDSHREAMGRKIVANLHFLVQDTSLTPHFRTMLGSLQARWRQHVATADGGPAAAAADARSGIAQPASEAVRALWHPAPESLQ